MHKLWHYYNIVMKLFAIGTSLWVCRWVASAPNIAIPKTIWMKEKTQKRKHKKQRMLIEISLYLLKSTWVTELGNGVNITRRLFLDDMTKFMPTIQHSLMLSRCRFETVIDRFKLFVVIVRINVHEMNSTWINWVKMLR